MRAALPKDAANDQTVASVRNVAAVTAVVVVVVAVVVVAVAKVAVKALHPKAVQRVVLMAAVANVVNARAKDAPKVAAQSVRTARSVQPASRARKTAMKAAAITPAKPSRATKVRTAKAVASATGHAATARNAQSVLNAASASSAMPSSRIRPWPTRPPWRRPWVAMRLHRDKTARLRMPAGMASAASQRDEEKDAMKPAQRDAATSRPAKADVSAANAVASAMAVATNAVASALTVLQQPRLQSARRTVLTPLTRPWCPVWTRPETRSHRCLRPKFGRALKARMKARSVSRAAVVTAMAASAVNVAIVASNQPRAVKPWPEPMFLCQMRLQRR